MSSVVCDLLLTRVVSQLQIAVAGGWVGAGIPCAMMKWVLGDLSYDAMGTNLLQSDPLALIRAKFAASSQTV